MYFSRTLGLNDHEREVGGLVLCPDPWLWATPLSLGGGGGGGASSTQIPAHTDWGHTALARFRAQLSLLLLTAIPFKGRSP